MTNQSVLKIKFQNDATTIIPSDKFDDLLENGIPPRAMYGERKIRSMKNNQSALNRFAVLLYRAEKVDAVRYST